MSRIGKKPINIPEGVEVNLEGRKVKITGPKGELEFIHRSAVKVKKEENQLLVEPARKDKSAKEIWGLTRTILANMILGVTEGFQKKLEFIGVGFRVNLVDDKLVFSLGFSHPIEFSAPQGINFKVEKNIITVEGPDKEKVGETAAQIRRFKIPDSYKGKGIRYLGEIIKLKPGKQVAKITEA